MVFLSWRGHLTKQDDFLDWTSSLSWPHARNRAHGKAGWAWFWSLHNNIHMYIRIPLKIWFYHYCWYNICGIGVSYGNTNGDEVREEEDRKPGRHKNQTPARYKEVKTSQNLGYNQTKPDYAYHCLKEFPLLFSSLPDGGWPQDEFLACGKAENSWG